MGSIRTWSLGVVAAILVGVVVHQRSTADADPTRDDPGPGAALTAPLPPAGPVPGRSSAPVRVTGLPDFSGLVDQNGALGGEHQRRGEARCGR